LLIRHVSAFIELETPSCSRQPNSGCKAGCRAKCATVVTIWPDIPHCFGRFHRHGFITKRQNPRFLHSQQNSCIQEQNRVRTSFFTLSPPRQIFPYCDFFWERIRRKTSKSATSNTQITLRYYRRICKVSHPLVTLQLAHF